jgi:SpoVK/Ycf46/Vps4 family AAA+-type ATPase
LAKKKKTLESRSEGYKKSFDRYLDLVDEAEKSGDLVRLRRNLGYAIEAWLSYTEAATSPAIRKAREENAAKLLDWYESLPENAADLPDPAGSPSGGSGSGGGGGGRGRKVKEGKDEAKDFIPVERPTLSFSDIAGLEDVKEDIRLKMIYPFSHPEAAARYKIRRGGGILLWGPPGTGKTMMARAVAGEIDAAFFTVKPSEIMSKWVGDSEQNIEALFKTARSHERSIIFIDEIEALIPSRRGESGSPIMKRLVPQILAELEGFGTSDENPLLFIGATNEPWSLDPAVLRPGRFDEKVYVGLPDRPARRKILELNLKGRPLSDDVDLDVLADKTVSYSGADVKNICEKAAADCFLKAVKAHGGDGPVEDVPPIGLEDLLNAIREARPSVTAEDLEKFIEYRDSNWGGAE